MLQSRAPGAWASVAVCRLWSVGSVVVAQGSVAPQHVDLPGLGIKLVSHVLAGRFQSTACQGSFPPCLVLLLGFYLAPLSGAWSSVGSVCLSLCSYFCVSGRRALFPDPGEALMQDTPSGVQQPSSLRSPELHALGVPLGGLHRPLRCGGRTSAGTQGRKAGSQAPPPAGGTAHRAHFVGNFEGIKRWCLLGDRHLCQAISGKGLGRGLPGLGSRGLGSSPDLWASVFLAAKWGRYHLSWLTYFK